MFPTKDAAGNPMTAEYGYCEYQNTQKLILQEMPEQSPTGQLPRSIMVILEGSLVDQVKPGDRIEITGVYKAVAQHTSAQNGFFKTVLVGTGVKQMSEITENMDITKHDIKNIRMIARKSDVLETLATSIAPSIQGHDNIKRSLLL